MSKVLWWISWISSLCKRVTRMHSNQDTGLYNGICPPNLVILIKYTVKNTWFYLCVLDACSLCLPFTKMWYINYAFFACPTILSICHTWSMCEKHEAVPSTTPLRNWYRRLATIIYIAHKCFSGQLANIIFNYAAAISLATAFWKLLIGSLQNLDCHSRFYHTVSLDQFWVNPQLSPNLIGQWFPIANFETIRQNFVKLLQHTQYNKQSIWAVVNARIFRLQLPSFNGSWVISFKLFILSS